MKKKKILITGAAGFIGFHLSLKLQNQKNFNIVGIDNLNNYYDQKLKYLRLKLIKKNGNKNKFKFYRIDIRNYNQLKNLFRKEKFDIIINLAAQAGVRHSLKKPQDYLTNNILGFGNILECCKKFNIKHLYYASSSSVYGLNKKLSFKETDNTDFPTNIYGASKKSNELMAHAYSYLFNLPTTGLRFFTAYGPWGRPDMSLYKFSRSIKRNKKIELFNYGKHIRDFTFIDDICLGIEKLIQKNNKFILKNKIPFEILNFGSNRPIKLRKYVAVIEKILKKKAKIKYTAKQLGDVVGTNANNKKLKRIINYKPSTKIEEGIRKYLKWFGDYE